MSDSTTKPISLPGQLIALLLLKYAATLVKALSATVQYTGRQEITDLGCS